MILFRLTEYIADSIVTIPGLKLAVVFGGAPGGTVISRTDLAVNTATGIKKVRKSTKASRTHQFVKHLLRNNSKVFLSLAGTAPIPNSYAVPSFNVPSSFRPLSFCHHSARPTVPASVRRRNNDKNTSDDPADNG
jgi:hypothetical protein